MIVLVGRTDAANLRSVQPAFTIGIQDGDFVGAAPDIVGVLNWGRQVAGIWWGVGCPVIGPHSKECTDIVMDLLLLGWLTAAHPAYAERLLRYSRALADRSPINQLRDRLHSRRRHTLIARAVLDLWDSGRTSAVIERLGKFTRAEWGVTHEAGEIFALL